MWVCVCVCECVLYFCFSLLGAESKVGGVNSELEDVRFGGVVKEQSESVADASGGIEPDTENSQTGGEQSISE